MGEKKVQLPEPMKALANDLGLNPQDLGNFDLSSIFKKGSNSILFLTRIGHVYSQNYQYEEENKKLRTEIEELKNQLSDFGSQIVALQKDEIRLQSENEFLSTTGQNSIPGAILFSIGSILIGICGGYVNGKSYLYAAIAGLIGVAISGFAASLIIRRKKGGTKDA